MASFPPSHPGQRPADGASDGRGEKPEEQRRGECLPQDVPRARRSLAPIRWATCTENPVAAAVHTPLKSHVVVDTSPMDAEAFAPRLPTIEASM